MNRSSLLSSLFTAILVLCAVVLTAAVAKREFASEPGEPALRARRIAGADTLAAVGHTLGKADAPVKIVEFSDFQCPYCARVQAALDSVRTRHPDRVAIVFRHFPLDAIHPHARRAAEAAECAGEQGRFAAYHDALFARQDSIGVTPWEGFARVADVGDVDLFSACMASGRHAPAVERDARSAAALGLEVTPSLIVNGVLRPGMVSATELERWVLDGR